MSCNFGFRTSHVVVGSTHGPRLFHNNLSICVNNLLRFQVVNSAIQSSGFVKQVSCIIAASTKNTAMNLFNNDSMSSSVSGWPVSISRCGCKQPWSKLSTCFCHFGELWTLSATCGHRVATRASHSSYKSDCLSERLSHTYECT
eukprot:6491531-Amphidinium_carterae.3